MPTAPVPGAPRKGACLALALILASIVEMWSSISIIYIYIYIYILHTRIPAPHMQLSCTFAYTCRPVRLYVSMCVCILYIYIYYNYIYIYIYYACAFVISTRKACANESLVQQVPNGSRHTGCPLPQAPRYIEVPSHDSMTATTGTTADVDTTTVSALTRV